MRIELSDVLPVAIDEAWRRLLVWEDQARWMKDASWVRVDGEQREGVGTRIRVKTLLYGVPAFVEPMEVVAWEPPRRIRMRHGTFVKGVGEWLLEPLDANETRITWIEDVSLRVPVVGEPAARVYSGFMRSLMRGSLEGLKDFLGTPEDARE